jgi:hypothetical protein
MNANRCKREDELLSALARGFVDAELAGHVRDCQPCGELERVAGALLEDRVVAMGEAHLPSAGTMWWRIQMREQQAMQAAASRSLLIGQAATLVLAIALIAVFLGGDVVAGFRSVVASLRLSTPIALVAGWVAIRQR